RAVIDGFKRATHPGLLLISGRFETGKREYVVSWHGPASARRVAKMIKTRLATKTKNTLLA
ncbi:hypothetical protein, partial [Bradyrhizobium sp.]|uniref:hypothetical protein n=1 Tax=Bradyrhizobium sp. TaxID=376 RepID=UPI003C6F206E